MYQAPRGTVDVLPQEQSYWRYIEEKVVHICQLYGYERIDFPAFEDAGLFRRSVGEGTDVVEKEMYTFDDRGGNQLALIPEGTASVCRSYVEHGLHNLPKPVKLYYVTSVFRYDRPQAGRYRQHRQFGCEAIGDGDPALDAEVIDMASRFFQEQGLTCLSLHLNSIGCKNCRPDYLAALKDYYTRSVGRLCSDCKVRLTRNPLRLLDCKKVTCQQIADAAPKSIDYLCSNCAEHFSQLQRYLGLLGLPFALNHRLVRGLDYYTRTVFEFQPETEGGQSTLGGGGRYDDLIEGLGGKSTPAIGLAVGMERIIINLKKYNVTVPSLPRPRVFLAYLGAEAGDETMKLTSRLRQSGVEVIQTLGTKSLKAQLRQANALGVQHAVIIGDQEVKSGTAIVRNMATARQETVPFDRLPELLK
ncbi:MAG: histidine--tRNA ligase [Dehalococcoidales bacterium]|nr:histidine--tRNA ligase [Dehalococcoidales bacterium]MDP6738311.1 histidine--tRNA ligase [Dehalococcoidales bacterium]